MYVYMTRKGKAEEDWKHAWLGIEVLLQERNKHKVDYFSIKRDQTVKDQWKLAKKCFFKCIARRGEICVHFK